MKKAIFLLIAAVSIILGGCGHSARDDNPVAPVDPEVTDGTCLLQIPYRMARQGEGGDFCYQCSEGFAWFDAELIVSDLLRGETKQWPINDYDRCRWLTTECRRGKYEVVISGTDLNGDSANTDSQIIYIVHDDGIITGPVGHELHVGESLSVTFDAVTRWRGDVEVPFSELADVSKVTAVFVNLWTNEFYEVNVPLQNGSDTWVSDSWTPTSAGEHWFAFLYEMTDGSIMTSAPISVSVVN